MKVTLDKWWKLDRNGLGGEKRGGRKLFPEMVRDFGGAGTFE
jgi:hypothetical protein